MSTQLAGDPNIFADDFTIPEDGDGPVKAADVTVPFEALADRTMWLKSHRLHAIVHGYHDDTGGPFGSWSDHTEFTNPSPENARVSLAVDQDDVLLVTATAVVAIDTSSDSGAHVALFATDDGEGEVQIPGAISVVNPGAAAIRYDTITLVGTWTVATTGTTLVDIRAQMIDADDDMSLALYSLTVQHFKGYEVE